jgi:hypothetical protein
MVWCENGGKNAIWGEGSNVPAFSVSAELWREGSRQNCSMRLNYAAVEEFHYSAEDLQSGPGIYDGNDGAAG